jgi:hypothetical protein
MIMPRYKTLIMIRVLILDPRLSSGVFLGNGASVSKRVVFETILLLKEAR